MWANENWTRRWDGLDDDVLIEQSYSEESEDALLADWCRHFADPRYIKADGRPLLLIYRPGIIPNAPETIARWRYRLATEFGQRPWMLMAQCFGDSDPRLFNLDGAFEFPPHKLATDLPSINSQLISLDPGFHQHCYFLRASRGTVTLWAQGHVSSHQGALSFVGQ